MPIDLTGGLAQAKAEGEAQAKLDAVKKAQASVAATRDGIEGNVNVTRGRLTFTAYLKAIVFGQEKRSVEGGGRIDVDLTPR